MWEEKTNYTEVGRYQPLSPLQNGPLEVPDEVRDVGHAMPWAFLPIGCLKLCFYGIRELASATSKSRTSSGPVWSWWLTEVDICLYSVRDHLPLSRRVTGPLCLYLHYRSDRGFSSDNLIESVYMFLNSHRRVNSCSHLPVQIWLLQIAGYIFSIVALLTTISIYICFR